MKHLVLFEEFNPKDTNPKEIWDIPTSNNSAIVSVDFYYNSDGEPITVVKDHMMVMNGLINDVSDNDHDNGGYQFKLNRDWLDVTLGNSIVNYMEKNIRDFTRPIKIEVVLRPEGVNKNIKLEYDLYNRNYKINKRKYLSLD